MVKYKLTIKVDENTSKEVIVNNRREICKILNITENTLNNFMCGRTKHKYDYIKIERYIDTEDKKKEQKENKKKISDDIKRQQKEQSKQQILKAIEDYGK